MYKVIASGGREPTSATFDLITTARAHLFERVRLGYTHVVILRDNVILATYSGVI